MVNSRPYASVWCITGYILSDVGEKVGKSYVVRDNGVVAGMNQGSKEDAR